MQRFSTKNAFLGLLIFIGFLGVPSYMAVRNTFIFSRSDTRVTSYYWLKDNLKKNDIILYNKNNLAQVTSLLPNNTIKLPPGKPIYAPGVLVLSYDDPQEVSEIKYIYNRSIAEKRIYINNELRLGPQIEIFYFD